MAAVRTSSSISAGWQETPQLLTTPHKRRGIPGLLVSMIARTRINANAEQIDVSFVR